MEQTIMDAVYARQSVEKADSISIESQIAFCAYETRGAPYRTYTDRGYSGKNTDRPGFQQMLSDIRRGIIRRVICYKLDRCSRSILDFANLMEEFQRFGVEFVSCTEKFDTATPMGRAMLNICIVFAQLERETIQQRVCDAYHMRNIRGFYMGGRIPYGYRLEPYEIDGKKTSRYATVETEAAIVRRIYELYANPLCSLADVAAAVKDEVPWSRSRIGKMLKNPIYVRADIAVYRYFLEKGVQIHSEPEIFSGICGCYLYSDKEEEGSILQGKHLVVAPHPGIVPAQLWLRCNEKRTERQKANPQYKIRNTWLAGKLKCGICGGALVVRKTVKKSGKTYRYLRCTGKNCSGNPGVKADELEEILGEEIKRKAAAVLGYRISPSSESEEKMVDAELRMVKLERQIAVLREKAMEATGALMDRLSEEASRLEAQKQALIRRRSVRLSRCDRRDPEMAGNWEHLSLEDKRLTADVLLEGVSVSGGSIRIRWKL